MKKLELIIGLLAFICLMVNLVFPASSVILSVFSIFTLAVFYFAFSFYLFNNVSLKDTKEDIIPLRRTGSLVSGVVISILLIGILFKAASWPGAKIMLQAGVAGGMIIFIVCAVKYIKTKAGYYSRILIRICIYGSIGLLLLLQPALIREIRFRNHPRYLEAVKAAQENPGNEELWKIVDKEWEKVRNANKK